MVDEPLCGRHISACVTSKWSLAHPDPTCPGPDNEIQCNDKCIKMCTQIRETDIYIYVIMFVFVYVCVITNHCRHSNLQMHSPKQISRFPCQSEPSLQFVMLLTWSLQSVSKAPDGGEEAS